MFPLLEEFRGFRIERRAPDFEFTPGLLGKITTSVVVPPEGGAAIFAAYELAGSDWHKVPAPRWWVSVVKPS